MLLRLKSLHLSRSAAVAIIVAAVIAMSGCVSGAGDGGQDGNSDGTSSAPGGNAGSDSGSGSGSGTGTGTGGDTGSGTGGTGSGTGGGTGSGTGGGTGGSDTGTVYGTLASLYINSDINPSLDVVSCSSPSSGSVTFSSAVLRVIGQNGNYVDGVLTLTPNSSFSSEFDQIFINMSGQFQSDGSFTGTISNMIYSLNGNIVTQAIGTLTINVFGASISIEFNADINSPACGLAGGFFMSETTDPGTGGGTGGDTGGTGGTGGGTGGTGGTGSTGGTGTGSTGTDGSLVQATGQFGILTFDSTAHPEDSGSFQLTSSTLITHVDHEILIWTNTEQTTINVYFGFGDVLHASGYMTFNSANDNSYICLCFPTVDLINYEASFNNLILTDTRDSTATISVNGILAFPVLN